MAQVADYDVLNNTGAQVRGDINNIFGAIKSCNSGSSDPVSPIEFMLYGDESDKILKIYSTTNSQFTEIGNINEDNLGLLPKDGATAMSGGLQLIAGAANNLSLKFSGDSDTGLFRQDSNVLGIVAGGTERVRVDSGGFKVRNGHSLQIWNSGNGNRIQFSYTGSSNPNFTLPTADGSNGSVLQTNGSGQLSFIAKQDVPTGSVFCMAVATVPGGYLECNGDKKSRTEFNALFLVIGTQYNTGGETSSEFRLPDLRGEFIRGLDRGRGVDSGRQIGAHQSGANASHNHSISASGTTSTKSLTGSADKISESFNQGNTSGVFGRGTNQTSGLTPNRPDSSATGTLTIDASHNHTVSVSGTSGSQGSEARPRNFAMMYIIKT